MSRNRTWSQGLKSVYRREPVLAIALTAGTLDLCIGTVRGAPLLAFLGLIAVSGSLTLRWWHAQKRPYEVPYPAPLYLPQSTARPPMPLLMARHDRHSREGHRREDR